LLQQTLAHLHGDATTHQASAHNAHSFDRNGLDTFGKILNFFPGSLRRKHVAQRR